MTATVLRGDARRLPLPDASVDLIVTSPPYFGLRSYTDGGEHYGGQIGSEATPGEWVAALVECTREWVRVLKPSGSMFVNLGDSYSAYNNNRGRSASFSAAADDARPPGVSLPGGVRNKSLLGLPWRYALACTDQLGLILRRDIIWAKPNGLPESVTDRCRSSHEYLFHLVKQPRYYAAVDEIREPHSAGTHPGRTRAVESLSGNGVTHRTFTGNTDLSNPLGKLPGSVWNIASQPLTIPAHLGIDHFAAFPMELPRRVIAGWSPPGICTTCGEGRRPVVDRYDERPANGWPPGYGKSTRLVTGVPGSSRPAFSGTITGYACACTTTDLPGPDVSDYAKCRAGEPPTRPAVVLDPFCGTGTTMLVASVLGRHGIGTDLSLDYCRLAKWRTSDPGERARAMEVPKPPKQLDGQEALWA